MSPAPGLRTLSPGLRHGFLILRQTWPSCAPFFPFEDQQVNRNSWLQHASGFGVSERQNRVRSSSLGSISMVQLVALPLEVCGNTEWSLSDLSIATTMYFMLSKSSYCLLRNGLEAARDACAHLATKWLLEQIAKPARIPA